MLTCCQTSTVNCLVRGNWLYYKGEDFFGINTSSTRRLRSSTKSSAKSWATDRLHIGESKACSRPNKGRGSLVRATIEIVIFNKKGSARWVANQKMTICYLDVSEGVFINSIFLTERERFILGYLVVCCCAVPWRAMPNSLLYRIVSMSIVTVIGQNSVPILNYRTFLSLSLMPFSRSICWMPECEYGIDCLLTRV